MGRSGGFAGRPGFNGGFNGGHGFNHFNNGFNHHRFNSNSVIFVGPSPFWYSSPPVVYSPPSVYFAPQVTPDPTADVVLPGRTDGSAGTACHRVPDRPLRVAGRRNGHAVHLGLDPESAVGPAGPATRADRSPGAASGPVAKPAPTPNGAIYRWTDDNGVTTITDDINKVPDRYRIHLVNRTHL